MNDTIIETIDLSKIYKLKGRKQEINALNNVNISINEGEIFGLLGPNGAGKTTLIEILTTLLQPTSGYARIDGINVVEAPKKIKSLIGLMLGSEMLYYRITGYDNLKFFCKIYKVPNYKEKINSITKDFGLENWLKQYVGLYSGGMKLKLALCRTLLLERKILFLDEPTLGLDVNSKNLIVKKLKELKKTIFLSSHDMSVVEKLCDRVAFINKGKILNVGTKNEIKKLTQSQIKITVEIKESKNLLKNELDNLDFVQETRDNHRGLMIILKHRESYPELLRFIGKYDVLRVSEPEPSLEELFIKLID